MNDTSESTKDTQSSIGVPVAIVIAGALVAAAIYLGGGGGFGKAPVGDENGEVAVAPEAEVDNPAAPAVGEVRAVSDSDHVRGPADAKVTVVEYSDIECPFCKRFHPTMIQLLEEYPKDVRWVWRHFPLEQLHENARIAAIATECAGEQGKFWETIDYMMGEEGAAKELTEENLPAVAKKVGVTNIAQFTTCLSDEKYNKKVDDDIADAAAAGGRGTPYSVVIGADGKKEAISGAQPYAALKAVVEKHL